MSGDGRRRQISTGCRAGDVRGAEQALAAYLGQRTVRDFERARDRDPAAVPIANVLMAYWQAREASVKYRNDLQYLLKRLTEWWGEKMVGDITPEVCDRYVAYRMASPTVRSTATPRKELATLNAAVQLAYENRKLLQPVPVQLPPAPTGRVRWLTRSEAAKLLNALRAPERRHVARWFLVALYTGTRSGAVCGATLWPTAGHGWVDLERGVFHRRPEGEIETNKRKPPIRLPDRLLVHMRRWQRLHLSRQYVVEYDGKPITRIKRAFNTARDLAGLDKSVTPHVLRHTCATWLMMNGADMWEAAGFLGMTREILEARYGHHHPNHQSSVHVAFARKHTSSKQPDKPK